jgi:excisionase family DNA binding protein
MNLPEASSVFGSTRATQPLGMEKRCRKVQPLPAESRLLLNYREAALALGVCERTLRNFVYRGDLPMVKLGKRSLFDVDDLHSLIDANKVRQSEQEEPNGPKLVQSGLKRKTGTQPCAG